MNSIDRLARIDLNLLVSLYVLLDERNVSRAAERLFVTQPAASRTLTRLRELFDDELLTRSGNEMVMTPRAQQLHELLPRVLEEVGAVVAPLEFDPGTLEQTFTVAIPEVFGQAIIQPLLAELRDEAPGVALTFRDPDEYAMRELLSGDVDFLFTRETQSSLPAPLHREAVISVSGILLVSCDHPLAGRKKLSLVQLLEWDWIDCYPQGSPAPSGPIDDILEGSGALRRVVFRSTHMLTALQAVSGSHCVLLLASAAGNLSSMPLSLVELPIPPEIGQRTIGLDLLQHRRTLGSEAHHWFKAKLVKLLNE